MDVADKIITLARLRGTPVEPDWINMIVAHVDSRTVEAIWNILNGMALQDVARALCQDTLSPSEKAMVDWMRSNGMFASSKEVAAEFGLKVSTAVNRLVGAQRKGAIVAVFAYNRRGSGGRRMYFAPVDVVVTKDLVEKFCQRLEPGNYKLGDAPGKDRATTN